MITLGTLTAEALTLAYQHRDHAMGAVPLPARRWRGEPVVPAFDLETPEGIERATFLRLLEGLGARRDWTWKRVRSERAPIGAARSGYDLTSLATALVRLAHLGLDIDPGAWAELVGSRAEARRQRFASTGEHVCAAWPRQHGRCSAFDVVDWPAEVPPAWRTRAGFIVHRFTLGTIRAVGPKAKATERELAEHALRRAERGDRAWAA